jgi:dUTP pyrophosphatase
MQRTLVKTGVSVRIPAGYVGLLVPRSSLSKKNIILTNSCGIIDADYRGELLISLMYVNKACEEGYGPVGHSHIEAGERIAQLLIVPIALPEPIKYTGNDDDWTNTARGTGGFGSTGK